LQLPRIQTESKEQRCRWEDKDRYYFASEKPGRVLKTEVVLQESIFFPVLFPSVSGNQPIITSHQNKINWKYRLYQPKSLQLDRNINNENPGRVPSFEYREVPHNERQ